MIRAYKKGACKSFSQDFVAYALALQGNARRLQGEYASAEEFLREAHLELDHGSGDPVVFADVVSYRASLERDRRSFKEAKGLARLALSLYVKAGEDHLAGRILIQLAVTQGDAGEPAEAVASLRDALDLIDFAEEPHLEAMVYENLALFIAQAGDPQRGLEILSEHPIRSRASRRSRAHHQWTHGLIMEMLGDLEAAIEMLDDVRDEFAELGDAPNFAMSSLDLALVYTKIGYTQVVKHLAVEILPVLQQMNIPHEVLSALILFEQAAQSESLNLGFLEKLKNMLADRTPWRKMGRPN